MALFIMIIRKMTKNKWLELSLLVGLIISVALFSSMPIYTNAVLQRMLIKDLQNIQNDTGHYPGSLRAIVTGSPPAASGGNGWKEADNFISAQGDKFSLPIQLYARERGTIVVNLDPVDPSQVDSSSERTVEFMAEDGLQDHVRVVDGKLPSKEIVNGFYEAVVSSQVLSRKKLVVGNEFTVRSEELKEPIKVKVVGVVEAKEDSSGLLQSNWTTSDSSLMLDFDLFEHDFTGGGKLKVNFSKWTYAVDYHKMSLDKANRFAQVQQNIDGYLSGKFENYFVKAPAMEKMATYFQQEKKLRVILWSLNTPVMIMLAFYLFMVSNLITERQKTEIAVIRSRGGSRWQILLGYVVEGILLGAVAFVVGPYLGMYLTKMLGASNGFLEFVQRSALDIQVGSQAFQYALIAVAGSVFMTLIPAYLATRVSIVGHKQQLARQEKASFWHKYFIDVILLAIAIYGMQSFRRRMSDLQSLGLASQDLKIDPLLFIIPALFVLGAGLVLLRLYPWLIRLVYWLGRHWWPPSLYSTLIQVGRSTVQYHFIMVFLILTLATGLFSASAARTMNRNMEDTIRYMGGADIKLQVKWDNDAPSAGGDAGSADGNTPAAPAAGPNELPPAPKKVQFSEPPFEPFAKLPEVEAAAKVYNKSGIELQAGKKSSTVQLMGIETDSFGRVAWMQDRLLDHHFYSYLNLIASDPSAVLVSKSLADANELKPGSSITLTGSGGKPAQFIVYGVIDYWPSWNPNPVLEGGNSDANANSDKKTKTSIPNLVVGQLPYIQNNMILEPYDIWLKLKPGASSQKLYNAISEGSLPITNLVDTHQQLIKSKNDPFRLAMNGVMTLGFLISIIISFLGFLIYWIISLSGKMLQFGILRAMGISFYQLIGMLVVEQLLTSGAGMLIGIITGNVTSRLYVPLFQLSFASSSQVPPFRVTFDPQDYIRLYFIVTVLLLLGLFILGYMLSRIKIHQAVKLGED